MFSYCIVTIQFLNYKTSQFLYWHNTVLYQKSFQFLYCHTAFPILRNGPVTVFSHCSSYTTKRSCYCIVTVQFLYYKTVQLLYCHNTVPKLQNLPVSVLTQYSPILQNGHINFFSHCISFTTKRSSYYIVTVQFLYYKPSICCMVNMQFLCYKAVQFLYCHIAFLLLQNGPVTVLSQYISYSTNQSSYCSVTVHFLY